MSELSVLIELQSVHDNLRIIQRDLSAFPPDLAALDAELKTLARKIEETTRGLAASRSLFASLTTELGGAQKAEELAKASVKESHPEDPVHRGHPRTGRAPAAEERRGPPGEGDRDPHREPGAARRGAEGAPGRGPEAVRRAQGRLPLRARQPGRGPGPAAGAQRELEAQLAPGLLAKFGACSSSARGGPWWASTTAPAAAAAPGCAPPCVAQLREAETLFCESCQRILYDPAQAMSPLAEPPRTRLRTRIRRACEAGGRDPGADRAAARLQAPAPGPGAGGRRPWASPRFGENYVQEGVQKAQEAPDLRFVLIGPLQRNKAKAALANFQEIMTVDRPDLAERLRRLAEELDLVRGVWIQVDLWGEADQARAAATSPASRRCSRPWRAIPACRCRGFMAIPPPEDARAFLRPGRAARRLAAEAGPAAAAVHGHERRPGAGRRRRQRPGAHRHRLLRQPLTVVPTRWPPWRWPAAAPATPGWR